MKLVSGLIILLITICVFCGTVTALSSSTEDTAVSHQFTIKDTCVVLTNGCTYITKITFSKNLSIFFKDGVELTVTEDNVSYLDRYNLYLPKRISEDNRIVSISPKTVKFGVTFVAKGNNGYQLGIGKPGTFTFALQGNESEELAVGWFWNGEWRNCPIYPLGNNRWQVEYTKLDGYFVILGFEKGTVHPFTGVAKEAPTISATTYPTTQPPENESELPIVQPTEPISQTNDESGTFIPIIIGIVTAVIAIGAGSVLFIKRRKTQHTDKKSTEK